MSEQANFVPDYGEDYSTNGLLIDRPGFSGGPGNQPRMSCSKGVKVQFN